MKNNSKVVFTFASLALGVSCIRTALHRYTRKKSDGTIFLPYRDANGRMVTR